MRDLGLLRRRFEDLLRALTVERADIREAMVFALDNADCAAEVCGSQLYFSWGSAHVKLGCMLQSDCILLPFLVLFVSKLRAVLHGSSK